MNASEVVLTHTSGSVLFCRHADGGVSLLRGGMKGKPECFLSASRDGWDLIIEKMKERPAESEMGWAEEEFEKQDSGDA